VENAEVENEGGNYSKYEKSIILLARKDDCHSFPSVRLFPCDSGCIRQLYLAIIACISCSLSDLRMATDDGSASLCIRPGLRLTSALGTHNCRSLRFSPVNPLHDAECLFLY